MGLRITSWNVNGIRNPFGYQPWRENKTFEAMFNTLEADIVVMQETKIQRKDLRDDMVLVPGWDVFFSLPRHKKGMEHLTETKLGVEVIPCMRKERRETKLTRLKGYAGVAIYTRNSQCAPIRAEEGIVGVLCPPNSNTQFRDLPEDQQIGGYPRPGQLQLSERIDENTLDSEGRCVILEFPAFVLIGTYSPANRDESRDDFRQSYMEALDIRVRNLVAMGKRVIVTGDLNVVRDALDTANLAERLRKEEMTMADFFSTPSRRVFNQLLFEGNVIGSRDEGREEPVLWDLGRLFHPTRQGMFTCWDTKKNCRPGNFGSRIDYVLCSDAMKDWFTDSNIQEGLMGSDHCPVFAVLSDIVRIDGADVHIRDIMNPPGIFKDGKRLREWSTKDLLLLSAKLIPEFDRRQNIKDMFFKKPTNASGVANQPRAALASQSNSANQSSTPDIPIAAVSDSPSSTSKASSPIKSSTGGLKRTPSVSSVSNKPQKKPRPGLSKEVSTKGQSSLMGFFKPSSSSSMVDKPDKEPDLSINGLDGAGDVEPSQTSYPTEATVDTDVDGVGHSLPTGPEIVFDPIQAKESWSKLLGKRTIPKCEHGEDCISLVTKKAGVNRGRSFFICPRPLGPSGEKEKGTEWRCGTFIWSSDWKPSNAT
ncbi:DNA lyase [Xylariaceae sp. FL0594]|nr:DNA lyase [Xylariaceae sp. FL0594]